MRNRIIALTLTVVMVVVALASCSSPYNYAEEDLSGYATFDAAAFKEALQKIEIEDADFTTDEETRQKKITQAIFKTLANYAETNGEKQTEGAFGMNDVLYFAYYTTYEENGVTYFFNTDNMKDTAFSTTSAKNGHNIILSAIDVEDKKADGLSVAIKKAIEALADRTISAYETFTTSGTAIKDSANAASYDVVYVSYTRTYDVTEGEGEAAVTKTITETSKFERVDLKNAEDKFTKILLDANTTAKIGSTISIKNGDKTESTFKLTEGETEYTYSNFTVKYAVTEEGKELVSFKYAPYTEETKDKELTPDNLVNSTKKVTIPKDAELTYHIYPVFYYQVSDITALSILHEAFASKITATSLEILESEEYKNGDKTVKALVEELVKIYSKDETTKYDNATKTAKTAEETAQKAYDAAAKVVADAGANATEEQKTAEANAKTALDEAKAAHEKAKTQQKTDAKAKIEEILKATKAEADPIADVVVKEYREDLYHTEKETYDSAIIEKLGDAIWELISDSVKVTGYPETLVKETVEHITNEYEYKFYKENTSTSSNAESNYSAYDGDFNKYLIATLKADSKDDIPAKLNAEAKELVKPIIQLYVVAKALAADAEAVMKTQLDDNSFRFGEDFGNYYSYSSDIDDNKAFAYYCAENFVVTNATFEKFKDIYGDILFENYVSSYGEANLRTSMQANNLFDYLLSAKLSEKKDGDHAHAEYTYKDGKLDLYNISYSIKVEAEDGDGDGATE